MTREERNLWRSGNPFWPIASTFSPPLLAPNRSQFGPLTFTPSLSAAILHSPSLTPRLPPQYPKLALSRFLQNFAPISSSSSSFITPNSPSDYHAFNSLQLLQIVDKNLIIVFFPAGENSDRVGFSLLSIKDGVLGVHSQREDFFHVVEEGNVNRQRITCLFINPVDNFCFGDKGDDISKVVYNVLTTVGILMVCTKYSIFWYRIGITTTRKNEDFVSLDCVGTADSRMLKGSSVASVCWSPHFTEECLVLLESGDFILFDVDYSNVGKANSIFSVNSLVNKKLQVPLSDKLGLKVGSHSKEQEWFGCEFSWHPRMFVVCHRNEILLVDLRSGAKCSVCCLLKLDVLSLGKNDGFLSLSKAGSDGFYFVVATRNVLVLCDVRKPLVPVLQWRHTVQNPQYLTVFKLSELRANAKDTKYNLASESGYCVILGSFWDNNFSIFCYGPDDNGNESIRSEISKFCNSNYKWGFPSELSLSGSDCMCGSCLVIEEFWKSSLPVWTDWRHKKELVLGFGILKPDLSAELSSFGSFGGFTLVRLTSCGKIEAQHYQASWESDKVLEISHKRKRIQLEGTHLYDDNVQEYGGVKKFQHLRLEFLNAYLKDKLANLIVKKREKIKEGNGNSQKKISSKSKLSYHQEICVKLKNFGISRMNSAVLKDITWPTSIHEIALRSACTALPTSLLQLAFTTYSDFDEDNDNQNEPLEFLDIPTHLQAPPFPSRKPSNRSNKWSTKVQPSDAIVGPVLPNHFLTTLHEIYVDEVKDERELHQEESEAFSSHSKFKSLCDEVVEAVEENISSSEAKTRDDYVSLADDTEDLSYQMQDLNLSCYNPSAFLESSLTGCEGNIYSSHVFRRSQEMGFDLSEKMVGREIFDVGCPVELTFDDDDGDGDSSIGFGPKELEIFRNLKKQDLEFQKSFKPYQEYIVRCNQPR